MDPNERWFARLAVTALAALGCAGSWQPVDAAAVRARGPRTILVAVPILPNFGFGTDVGSSMHPVPAHPPATMTGKRGESALIGGGACIDWRSYRWAGNLPWKLRPSPDLGAVEAASKDHVHTSPTTLTGYAARIKLVPRPVPVAPVRIERPQSAPRQ